MTNRHRSVGRLGSVFVLLLSGFACPIAGAETSLAGLDGQVEKMMADWNVPGMALAIVKDDQVIHSRGYGVRETGKRARVDDETMFAIGSSSKAFTAAGLAILVDEEKLSWDDTVQDHLPWFQLYDPFVTREMRVRDLLAHNSGLIRGDRVWYGTGISREEIVRRARYLPPTYSLRARFQYNNTMFIAAGLVIEAVSGQTWDDFTTERILNPLGMSTSGTSVRDLKKMPNVATPHMEANGKVFPVPYRNIDNAGPAGSINSNVKEMAQWVRLQLGKGELEGQKLISEKNVTEMHSAQMLMVKEGLWGAIFSDSALLSYGLGWFLGEHEGRLWVNHGGNIDGNTAFVSFLPDEQMGLVILSNLNASNGFISALNYEIFERMLELDDKDWSAQFLAVIEAAKSQAEAEQQKIRDARVGGTSPSLPLASYAGEYTHDMYPSVVVRTENGQLTASYAGAFSATLEHWHFDTFHAKWNESMAGDTSLNLASFDLGRDGKPSAIHLDIEGTVAFRRTPEEVQD